MINRNNLNFKTIIERIIIKINNFRTEIVIGARTKIFRLELVLIKMKILRIERVMNKINYLEQI